MIFKEALEYSLDVLVKLYGFILDYIFYIVALVILYYIIKTRIVNFIKLINIDFHPSRYEEIRPEMECILTELGTSVLYQDLRLLNGKTLIPNCYLPDGNGGRIKYDTIMLDKRGIHIFEILDYVSANDFFGNLTDAFWRRECEGETGYIPNPGKRVKEKEAYFKKLFPEYADKNIYTHVVLAEKCFFEGEKDVLNQFVYNYTQAYLFLRQLNKQLAKCMTKREIKDLKKKIIQKAKMKRKEYEKCCAEEGIYYEAYHSMNNFDEGDAAIICSG